MDYFYCVFVRSMKKNGHEAYNDFFFFNLDQLMISLDSSI